MGVRGEEWEGVMERRGKEGVRKRERERSEGDGKGKSRGRI